MTRGQVVLLSGVLLLSLFDGAAAGAQVSQSEISRQLLRGTGIEQSQAVEMAREMGAQAINAELRAALVAGLAREGILNNQRRNGEIASLENPELIAKLAYLVAQFRDPRSIPALAGALGTSPPAMFALADFGEPAAPVVVDVVNNSEDASVLMDALVSLRLMVEAEGAKPLSAITLVAVRQVAEQRLLGRQFVTTLWRAIDLAVVLNDPELRRVVESLAMDANTVIARGVVDPQLIELTQRHASDRLAGIPPLPRR
jgi:hypothetical protein